MGVSFFKKLVFVFLKKKKKGLAPGEGDPEQPDAARWRMGHRRRAR